MSNTTRHLIWGIGWFCGTPLIFIISVEAGLIPASSPLGSAVVSFLWTFGLIGVFLSWALKDAPSHGKSRYVALIFTVAWFLVLVFAVFPYLFATRGAKGGFLASLKFLSLLLVLGIFWVGAFRLSDALLGVGASQSGQLTARPLWAQSGISPRFLQTPFQSDEPSLLRPIRCSSLSSRETSTSRS